MVGAFKRSFEITKLTFDIIKKDKKLLLFPILAGLFSIAFIIAMIFPWILSPAIGPEGAYTSYDYLMVFLIYLGLAFIATFFNVCVVYSIKRKFEGKQATMGEAIKFAFSKIHLIFMWSLLAAIVGLILRILDNMAERIKSDIGRILAKILISILGGIWSMITIFVVPGMVYHDLGPIDAIKKSVGTLKKTWGESLVRIYGLGIVEFLLILAGALVGILLWFTFAWMGTIAMIAVLSLVGLYLLGVIILFSVANSVFNTALFHYAEKGQVPHGYSSEVLHHAFAKKEKD